MRVVRNYVCLARGVLYCQLTHKRALAAVNDPRLRVLDWDAMRVDKQAIDELANALRGNTNTRELRLQWNRDLTDDGLFELDEVLRTAGCGVTEVLCVAGTGVSEAKAHALSQIIDLRRLHANDPDLTEIFWSTRSRQCVLHGCISTYDIYIYGHLRIGVSKSILSFAHNHLARI